MKLDFIASVKKASEQHIYDHLRLCNDNFIPPLSERVSLDQYAEKLFLHAVTFEAWSNELLVGLVACYCNKPESKLAFITCVSVLPNWGSQGIATKLIGLCREYVCNSGFAKIQLKVDLRNQIAFRIYQRSGFNIFSQKDNVVSMELDFSR